MGCFEENQVGFFFLNWFFSTLPDGDMKKV